MRAIQRSFPFLRLLLRRSPRQIASPLWLTVPRRSLLPFITATTLLLLISSPREVFHLEAPRETIDPDTKLGFPNRIETIGGSCLRLIGLGVRVVSFLRVRVYVAGFYLQDARSLDLVKGIFIDGQNVEETMSRLLDLPMDAAIRIVPVRSTDFGHLRDGFYRSLLIRLKLAGQKGSLFPEQARRGSPSSLPSD